MVCAGLETLTDNSITGILAFPTSCHYWFYGEVMLGIFIILAMLLYQRDKEKYVKADMLSSLGVSAIATIFIALIGTFIKIIQQEVFITIFAGGMIFIILWLIKK